MCLHFISLFLEWIWVNWRIILRRMVNSINSFHWRYIRRQENDACVSYLYACWYRFLRWRLEKTGRRTFFKGKDIVSKKIHCRTHIKGLPPRWRWVPFPYYIYTGKWLFTFPNVSRQSGNCNTTKLILNYWKACRHANRTFTFSLVVANIQRSTMQRSCIHR